jgi:hypothetical protein
MAIPISLPPPATTMRVRSAYVRAGTRVLAIAVVASVLLHLSISLWPIEPPEVPDSTVLTATITELPPPPLRHLLRRRRSPSAAAPRPCGASACDRARAGPD